MIKSTDRHEIEQTFEWVDIEEYGNPKHTGEYLVRFQHISNSSDFYYDTLYCRSGLWVRHDTWYKVTHYKPFEFIEADHKNGVYNYKITQLRDTN